MYPLDLTVFWQKNSNLVNKRLISYQFRIVSQKEYQFGILYLINHATWQFIKVTYKNRLWTIPINIENRS